MPAYSYRLIVGNGSILPWFMRIVLGLLGLLALLHAAWGKGLYRWGWYEFEDDSDIVLDRRTGRMVATVIGIALIVGAILYKGHE